MKWEETELVVPSLPLAEDDSESKWNVGGGAEVGSQRQI